MQRILKSVPDWTLPYYTLIILFVCLGIAYWIQCKIYDRVRDYQTIWSGHCVVKGVNDKGVIGLVVDCAKQGSVVIQDTGFVRSYLKNPGKFKCKKSALGSITCDNQSTRWWR